MTEMTLNEESLCFYFELGVALTQFKHVSDSLYGILDQSISLDNQINTDALRNFANATTFGAQLSVTDNVLSNSLPAEFHSEWVGLRQSLDEARRNRNTLAHCWLMTDTSNGPGKRCMLLPTSGKECGETQNISDRAKHLLDVVRFRHQFFSLRNTLENFDWRLRGEPENYPNGQIAEPDEPTLDKIVMGPYSYLGVDRPARQ